MREYFTDFFLYEMSLKYIYFPCFMESYDGKFLIFYENVSLLWFSIFPFSFFQKHDDSTLNIDIKI